jgi:hypothetical protein
MAAAACVLVPFGHPRHEYLRTVVWAGVVLASAIGWGSGLARFLFGTDVRLGWGLEAALGLAVHLALGGVLAMLSLVSSRTTYVTVGVGVALCTVVGWARARRQPGLAELPRRTRPASVADATVLVLFFGIALLHAVGMAGERSANMWDDLEAYFSFAKQLLGSGTLIEPFSVRRIAAYGGQPYLHALVLVYSSVFRLGVVDNGICFLVLGGLALGWVRERPRLRTAVAAPALVGLVALPHLPHNSASELSSAVFFFALFRVLDRPRGRPAGEDRARGGADPTGPRSPRPESPRAPGDAARNALAIGLAAFGACTLRQSNLVPAAAIPAAWYAVRILRDRGRRWGWAREAGFVALFTTALLLPWMILAYRSSGTALYPAFQGNAVKEFGLFEPITRTEVAKFFVACVLFPGRLPGALFAFTAGLLQPRHRRNDALRASLAGTAAGAVALFLTLAQADDLDSTGRYFLPLELGYYLSACVAVAGAVRSGGSARGGALIAISFIVGALALQLSSGRDTLQTIYLGDIDAISAELDKPAQRDPDPADAPYAALQQTIPEHEKLLVMLDEPFRLDFKRNRILSWDQPGSASPKPKIPIGEGPEALAQYLQRVGVRYLAFHIGGSSPEYQLNTWEAWLKPGAPSGRDLRSRRPQLHAMARFYVDVLTNLPKLAASRKQLYADGGTYVLDLATPTPQ